MHYRSGTCRSRDRSELLAAKFRVFLLESGDTSVQQKVDIESELEFKSPNFRFGPGPLRHQFGGMAAIWSSLLPGAVIGTRYLPLDPIDFTRRYWVPHSGWPITFEEMKPYYERARTICGLGPFDYHGPLPEGGPPPLPTPSEVLTRLEQFGPSTVFTERPLDKLRKSEHTRVLTNAVAVEVTTAADSENGMQITEVRTRNGLRFAVRSRIVVLAGGAIENARLLLNSRSQHPDGLGNQFDNVGRYFMEHPRVLLGRGSVLRLDALDLYKPHRAGDQIVEGRLKLSEATLRREELLNGSAYIVPNHRLSTSQLHAARSARIAYNSIKNRRNMARVNTHLMMALRHAPALVWNAIHPHLTGLGMVSSEPESHATAKSFELIYQPEQAPNRLNRVTLSDRRDAFGYPIARLYWRWSEIDLLSIRRVGQILASSLQAADVAEFVRDEIALYPVGERAPRTPSTVHHLLGTTRMHDQPRHGVVDHDCKVHGSPSVYVAGGSVFTTGGNANPTLTVVALALRMAEQLKRQLDTRTILDAASKSELRTYVGHNHSTE